MSLSFRKGLTRGVLALASMLFANGYGRVVSAEPSTPVTPRIDETQTVEQVERTLFDIYLVDSFQGGVLVEYTETWLEIEDPNEVLEQLKEIKPEERSSLLPLFTGRIEGTRELAGVGSVSFDIYTFRLIITLAPEYLKSRGMKFTEQLPDPERGLSLQQTLGVAASGDLDGDTNSAFSHRSLIGSGRYFGRVYGAAVQDSEYQLTEASALGYVGNYEIGTGYLETPGQSFGNSLQFLGVRVRTSDEILLDADRGTGSRFEVFVPSRSRVEFYRNERLLSVQLLDFGLQEVNTASFPQGSYDVDVVIIESNGNVIRERKFFTKSGYLSVRGRPYIDLQVGTIRDEFSTTDEMVYQAGIRWRAGTAVDLGGSVYGTEELSIAEIELVSLFRESFFRVASSAADDGAAGISGNFSTTLLGTSLSLGAAETLNASDTAPPLRPTPPPTDDPLFPDDPFNPTKREQDLFFQDRSLYNASVRRSFGPVDLSYQDQREDFTDGVDRYSRGPALEWRIMDSSRSALRYVSRWFDTEQGDIVQNALNYRYRLAPRWNLSAQLAHFDREITGNELVGYFNINYNEGGRAETTTRLNYSAEVRRKSESDQGDSTIVTNQLVGEYRGSYLTGGAFVRSQAGEGADSSTSFGVTAESAALISSDGAAAISYPPSKEAVFIADIKNSIPGTKFDILLDDQVYDTVEAGKRSAVGVEPFKTYRVYIRPADSDELIEYDATTHFITFFPGNVVRRTFEAFKVFIALGRVVDQTGQPVAYQRIKGPKDYVATDEFGNFQAELVGGEPLVIESRSYRCALGSVPAPTSSESMYVVEMGEVICDGKLAEDAQFPE